jgi:hypothetical protein
MEMEVEMEKIDRVKITPEMVNIIPTERKPTSFCPIRTHFNFHLKFPASVRKENPREREKEGKGRE